MKRDSILILGRGYIGQRIQTALNCEIIDRKIYSFRDIRRALNGRKPRVLINCIGHTGERNINDCEKNPDKTIFANTFVPLLLAEFCLRNKIKLIHISTGCIFKFDYLKDRPIQEDRVPDFFDLFYSRSKIYAERGLEALAHRYGVLIVRIRVPLDNQPHPRNILTKLISYKKVINIPNSITYLPDFFMALRHLIEINASGVYNIVNKGALRYPQLLEVYKRYKPDFEYRVVDFKQLHMVRTNLLLSTRKLEKSGFRVRKIDEVLEECVKGYLKY